MKKVLSSLFFSAFFAVSGFSQVKTAAPSPTAYIKQDFALSSIELTYSRPGLKGRDVFGTLVHYDYLWRTGANAATKIKFNQPVTILGHSVDAGSYAIYTIPKKNNQWVFILNKGYSNSGLTGYKESDDLFRETVTATSIPAKIETFTMEFSNIKPESCELSLLWDNVRVNIPIKVDSKGK